jgi:methoxymalonate biosynthesis acyl carrier protein
VSTPTLPTPRTPTPRTPADLDDASQVRAFIETRVPGVTFGDADDIFALGIVNSLFAMELVLFLEKTAGIRIPNEELVMDHFRSIGEMTALTARLRQGPRGEVAP